MHKSLIYISVLTASVFSMAACSPNDQISVYRSLDGRTELIVSENFYYMGPANHPDDESFLEEYGQPLARTMVSGVECMSLGVFKLARFEGESASCQNVHIKRNVKNARGGVDTYVGSCFELAGNGCSGNKGFGSPALVYSYKVDPRRGLTEINVAGDNISRLGSTLTLASGPSLFK